MNIARGLEKRLEQLVDSASASVFRGKMHPIDMASRLMRQLEFLSSESVAGTEMPNVLSLRVNEADIDENLDTDKLIKELAYAVTETAAIMGWRLVGEVTVEITTSMDIPRGILEVVGKHRTSPIQPWGQLIADDGSTVLEISMNRTLIGRALDCDIRIADQVISRNHVIIHRQNGTTMIRDLGSSNGSFLNGARLTEETVSINVGDTLVLGNISFTYRATH